jgi:hypothetical protein
VAEAARGWLDFWRDDIDQPGFYPFDWIAAAYVAEPSLFNCGEPWAWIEREWGFQLLPKSSLLVDRDKPHSATASKVIYCPAADSRIHAVLMSSPPPIVSAIKP